MQKSEVEEWQWIFVEKREALRVQLVHTAAPVGVLKLYVWTEM